MSLNDSADGNLLLLLLLLKGVDCRDVLEDFSPRFLLFFKHTCVVFVVAVGLYVWAHSGTCLCVCVDRDREVSREYARLTNLP